MTTIEIANRKSTERVEQMKEQKTETKAEQEGARGFSVTLQTLDEGRVHAELSETLQKLAGELSDFANNFGKAKGTLTLALNLEADSNGLVAVVADIKTKSPKIPHGRSIFWLTKGNNLTPENPRQQKLPLREVPTSQVRDIPADEKPAARGV